jgi:hypothetical protein
VASCRKSDWQLQLPAMRFYRKPTRAPRTNYGIIETAIPMSWNQRKLRCLWLRSSFRSWLYMIIQILPANITMYTLRSNTTLSLSPEMRMLLSVKVALRSPSRAYDTYCHRRGKRARSGVCPTCFQHNNGTRTSDSRMPHNNVAHPSHTPVITRRASKLSSLLVHNIAPGSPLAAANLACVYGREHLRT